MGIEQLQAFAREFARVFSEPEGVRAVFLGGSLASGLADDHSDLDLYVVAGDGELDSICRLVPELLATVGTILFLRPVDHGFPMFVFICAGGTRGEVGVIEASGLTDVHCGAYQVLFDRDGVLDGFVFPGWPFTADERQASVCRNLDWFWRAALNAGHYLARGDVWPASEELAAARRHAATLLRLRDRKGPNRPSAGLHRLPRELPEGDLKILEASFSALQIQPMAAGLAALCSAVHRLGQRELAPEDQRDRLAVLAELVRSLVPFA